MGSETDLTASRDSLKILICGGGCAGPALAFWLSRSGHRVVIVERSPVLRASGAQIDLRAQGIEVVRRMGLLDSVRSKRVNEAGVSFVDSAGRARATVRANTSGKGAQSLTSAYEIMRGDLVRILYDAVMDDVEYVFGKTVERFEQNEAQVVAYFSDGSSDTYDLLVGADGQGSRVRKAILPPDSPLPYRRLGMYIAYFFVPRVSTDDNLARLYFSPGGRLILLRSHSPTETQVYFILLDNREKSREIPGKSIEEQKRFWAQEFRDAGWQADRFLEGLETTENFYCQEVVQVRTDTWYRGRMVLLGDAAYCPSPLSGMGTTSSFVGAYILAGEIARNGKNLSQALANYDRTLRPFVKAIQRVSPTLLRMCFPKTRGSIAALHFLTGLLCFLRLPDLMARFLKEDMGGWKLPDYPEIARPQ